MEYSRRVTAGRDTIIQVLPALFGQVDWSSFHDTFGLSQMNGILDEKG